MPHRTEARSAVTRAMPAATSVLLVAALVFAAAVPVSADPGTGGATARAVLDTDPATAAAVELLRSSEHAARTSVTRGRLVVATTGAGAARVFAHDVERAPGALRISRDGQLSYSRDGDAASLHAPEGLIRIDGAGRLPLRFDALVTKYELRVGAAAGIDTGPAVPVSAYERATGRLREVLYLDVASGLLVRRETYDGSGRPRRVVAYTDLEVEPSALATSTEAVGGTTASPFEVAAEIDGGALAAAGFVVPDTLPDGFVLLAATELTSTSVPTAHLVYGDGLYTLSVFQQQGPFDQAAAADAVRTAVGDGDVWRWPGSEPRRLVWGGDGLTYTVLADAPLDVTLAAIAGLPCDPALSILSRLRRGLERVGTWVLGG